MSDPRAAIIDSQSVKSAEKRGASIRPEWLQTEERKSRVRNGIFL